MVDQWQSLTSDEHPIGFLSVSINHHPVFLIRTGCFGESDDGEALVEGADDFLEVEVVALADTDAVGAETADEGLGIESVLVVRAALREELLQGGTRTEGVEDHGTSHEAAGVGFELAVTRQVERAYIFSSWMLERIREEPQAGGAGEDIQRFFGGFGEVEHDDVYPLQVGE